MKEDAVALSHVPRHEKKLLLKGWNSSLQDVTKTLEPTENEHDAPSSLVVVPSSSCQGQEDDLSRMIQWLKMSSASKETSRSAVALEGPDDDMSHSNFYVVEPLPKTVAQVKHSYKVRARFEEKEHAKKAADAIKVRRAQLLLYEAEEADSKVYEGKIQSIRNKKRSARPPRPRPIEEEDMLFMPEPQQPQQQPQPNGYSVYRIENLNASAICLKRDFRDEVLGEIRKELVLGKHVLLENDCQITGESLNDTKLMMQQLCNQSLLYCIRDQDILPQVVDAHKVRLLLVSKVTRTTTSSTTTTGSPITTYQQGSSYYN